MSIFADKVLEIVKNIPAGEVKTYKQVAVLAGSPRAYRAVANLMKANYRDEIPCHRVVCSDGRIGEYNRAGGTKTKIKRLKDEGVIVESGRVIR